MEAGGPTNDDGTARCGMACLIGEMSPDAGQTMAVMVRGGGAERLCGDGDASAGGTAGG